MRLLCVAAILACACAGGSVRDGPQTTSVGEGGESDTTAASGDIQCVPGQQVECACPGGGPGAQACNADGSGYGPCECGGADAEASGSGEASSSGGSSGAAEVTSKTESSDGGETGDPQACLDQAGADMCQQCICENCLAEHDACAQDEGCTAIAACAQKHMCTGIACIQPCGPVIDQYGGISGHSALLANALSGCYEANCTECQPA